MATKPTTKSTEKTAGSGTTKKAPAATPAKQTATKATSAKAVKAVPQETPASKQPPKAAAKSPSKATAKTAVAKQPAAPKSQTTQSAPASAPPADSTQQKWSEIRTLLLQMKTTTLQEIAKSIKKGSEATVGEEPTGDIYDQASSERDRELGLILNDREREKLHSIDDALLRMAEGDYGICEECDEEIPQGRLKAMPFTRHCVKCKSELERIQAQTRRFEEDRSYREMPTGDDDEL